MNTVTRMLVNKRRIAETRIETSPQAPLAAGQVRLRIERFSMTANNISYAAIGELMQYWRFFPGDGDWGCVPCWGFATVVESSLPEVPVGERLWGFLPMGTELVVTPARVTDSGFVDATLHRQGLAGIYNEYSRCVHDPLHTDGDEDIEALLRPLFGTAWMVDDFLAEHAFFGADVAVLSSASSKTAYGTAARLAQRNGIKLIGLTASHNIRFVESLGCYHKVLAYDAVTDIDAQAKALYLDFAGDPSIRRAVHEHLHALHYSCLIGGSHADKAGPASGLPGPKPVFLFVPSQVAKRVAEWGEAELLQRMARDWRAFVVHATDPAQPWIRIEQHYGAAGMSTAYATVLGGQGDPRTGHMVAMVAA